MQATYVYTHTHTYTYISVSVSVSVCIHTQTRTQIQSTYTHAKTFTYIHAQTVILILLGDGPDWMFCSGSERSVPDRGRHLLQDRNKRQYRVQRIDIYAGTVIPRFSDIEKTKIEL